MQLPKTKTERIRFIVIALVIGVGGWFISHQFESLDLEELLKDVSETLGAWTYAIAGVLAFLETGAFIGLVVPGETFVILAGAVAGQGATDVFVTVAIVWFCAWAGDTTSFFIGRKLGRGFILKHGPRLRITEERFKQVEGYFDRHGGKTILVGRFIGLVRALAPFVAGSSGMEYGRFVPYSVLGTGLWAGVFTFLGYFGSQSIEEIANVAGQGVLLFGITVGVIVAIVAAVRFFREAENRRKTVAWMERRALLRPLVAAGRTVRPQAKFLWKRLTPGDLGLELTAMLAFVAVGLFVLITFASVVDAEPGPTPGDQAALDVAANLQAAWLTDIAKVVTALGSVTAVVIVGAISAVVLAIHRRWFDVAALIVALAICFTVVPNLKEVLDRPRPDGALVAVEGDAYPSGHATYAVIYVWLALIVTVRLRPGKAGGTAILVVGIALAAAIGLSRVYLRVHYMSDVAGGWGLGVAAFSGCAMIALVASHVGDLRNNDPP